MATKDTARNPLDRTGPEQNPEITQVPAGQGTEMAYRVTMLEGKMKHLDALNDALKAVIDAQAEHLRTQGEHIRTQSMQLEMQARKLEALGKTVDGLVDFITPRPTRGRGRSPTRYFGSRDWDSRSPASRSPASRSRSPASRSHAPQKNARGYRKRSHSRDSEQDSARNPQVVKHKKKGKKQPVFMPEAGASRVNEAD